MSVDTLIFDVVLAAIAEGIQHPERRGGGIVGKASAVVDALGLDGDLPLSSLKQKAPRR